MEQKVIIQAIVQARSESTRLKRKIFEPVCQKTLLEWAIERARTARLVDRIVIATSTNPADDAVAEWAYRAGIPCVRGPEEDVLGRFIMALDRYPSEVVARVTADNPLLDSATLDATIETHRASGADYTGVAGVVPIGSCAEAVNAGALRKADEETADPQYREHVTTYIHSHPGLFTVARAEPAGYLKDMSHRLTVDTGADLALMRAVCRRLEEKGEPFDAEHAVALLGREPELLGINRHVKQKDWRR